MTTHKALIIDDDTELCKLLQNCLATAGTEADVAHTASNGISLFLNGHYHVAILDVMLPDINGFSLLEQIRQNSNIPILMLTAKGDETDKVKGLQLGADDYLTKPFGIREFLARIESLIRRNTILNAHDSKALNSKLTFPTITFDADNRSVFIDSEFVKLTAKEFDLLYFLACNKGRIFTKSQLYNQVWHDEYAFDDNNIMSFISKLRKKIENPAKGLLFIETIRGVGYRFNHHG
ncbi:response regulator transcription factor [Niallia sp. MER 6]|uniref:response regulator transcription factor n=1 Tax=Niallia sp. MER 6 TaxID=2939567 RepID=UPI00203E9DCE|nr:response regulator transcription factor [Niallia sp. MER 6]MCM3033030.1 response regulator transcription factor [Niallia sp. MER 6]